jgi:hypothetical protein
MAWIPQSEPRQHHYLFAHRTMTQLVLGNWDDVRPTFADGTGGARLRGVWEALGATLPPEARLDSEGLGCQPIRLGDERGFLLTMPRPQAVAEAAYVVVPDRDTPRYFVLELGFSPVTKQPYWVFCEWRQDGHVNGGRVGPEVAGEPSEVLDAMTAHAVAVLGTAD